MPQVQRDDVGTGSPRHLPHHGGTLVGVAEHETIGGEFVEVVVCPRPGAPAPVMVEYWLDHRGEVAPCRRVAVVEPRLAHYDDGPSRSACIAGGGAVCRGH